MTNISPFHLAIPVHDIDEARAFYGGKLGCSEGRFAYNWIDFDFFGHQLVVHADPNMLPSTQPMHHTAVDAHNVPIPHFGIVLEWDAWEALAAKLKAADIKFVIEPSVRFAGQAGEQGTMFFLDPSGNALEFKGFKNMGNLFAK